MLSNSTHTVHTETKRLIIFFAITLLWTWSCGILAYLFRDNLSLVNVFFVLGGPAPSIVGFMLVMLTYTKAAKKDFFKRMFTIQPKKIKYLIIPLVAFLSVTAICCGITMLSEAELPEMAGTKEIIFAPYMLFVWLLISLLSGPLNEEFGWRGYSLDKLLERFGFFGATVVLGFIWGIWHFFWSFVPGQAQYEIFNYSKLDWLLFLTVFEIAVSFVIHLVYIKTERSILAGALSHMLCNLLASQLIAPMSAQYRSLFIYVTISVGVIFAIYTMVSKKFNSEVKFQINRIKADKARFGMSENVS